MSSPSASPEPPPVAAASGSQLLGEIREQPACAAPPAGAPARVRGSGPANARSAARCAFAWSATARPTTPRPTASTPSACCPGWTALRDSISLSVYYGAELDLSRSSVVAISQSGRTPDVVEYALKARRQGGLTVALTNDPHSALAETCELALPLGAGLEHAVAATKTYTTQVAALALLAGCAAGKGAVVADGIRRTAELLAEALPDLEARVAKPAVALAFVGRMFVIGRGPEFATAREISLKLLETCRVAAEPLTATDLAHGPVAALDGLFPVWAIASDDASLGSVREAAERVLDAGATLIASGTAADRIPGAAHVLPVPKPPIGLLAPLLSVVPGQLLARALAQAKGLDADRPAGLNKVTLAL